MSRMVIQLVKTLRKTYEESYSYLNSETTGSSLELLCKNIIEKRKGIRSTDTCSVERGSSILILSIHRIDITLILTTKTLYLRLLSFDSLTSPPSHRHPRQVVPYVVTRCHRCLSCFCYYFDCCIVLRKVLMVHGRQNVLQSLF